MTEKMARLWLSMGDLPSTKLSKIMALYEDALTFYQEREKALHLLGSNAQTALKAWSDEERLSMLLASLEKDSIRFLTPEDAEWPRGFYRLYDPPVGLFAKGNLDLLHSERSIAMVGTRRSSVYGRRMAQRVAGGLAEAGVTITSGFAVGIDSASHEGCLSAGGKTIAVIGCGLDVDYPSGNGALRKRILESGGLIISEYPPGTQPLAAHFPQRNRLIAALSQGLMLVEGASHSGGMISAQLALEMGLEVFAMPGPADVVGSEGPHALIRDGARLATSAEQILEDMGWQSASPEKSAEIPLEGEEAQLAALLEIESLSFEELCRCSGLDAQTLNSHLTIMELKGIIEKSPGRIYTKTR